MSVAKMDTKVIQPGKNEIVQPTKNGFTSRKSSIQTF